MTDSHDVEAVVMCGGKGTRLDSESEKPLFEIDGTAMIDRVIAALKESSVAAVYAAVSPHSPDTREHVAGVDGVSVIETPGEGYLNDAVVAFERVGAPVLTAPSDSPLLSGRFVDELLAAYDGRSFGCYTPVALNEQLEMNVNHPTDCNGYRCAATGLDITASPLHEDAERLRRENDEPEVKYRSLNVRPAVNVNTLSQARIAQRLLQ